MIITAYKSPFKKIAIAVLLLTFAPWLHEGFVICYGADGHVKIERPSDKNCCKAQEKSAQAPFSEQSESNHCVDIPIGAEKYIGSTSHTASFQNHAIPPSVVSPLFFVMDQPCPRIYNHDTTPPQSPLLACLKTIVLLI